MLFDPKIKHNGKIRNIQLIDPSKVTLKDFDKVKNSFKTGDSLIVNENDSITEAFAKLNESIHPSKNSDLAIKIDYDAMIKLYPNNINQASTNEYTEISNPFDGMKIIFTHNLDLITNKFVNQRKGRGMVTIIYGSTIDGSDYHSRVMFDLLGMVESTREMVVNNFIPTTIGDYDLSEFKHDYLIFDKYVPNTNYITIYKTNLQLFSVYVNTGRPGF